MSSTLRVESVPAAGHQVSLPVVALGSGLETFPAQWAIGAPPNTEIMLRGRTPLLPYAEFIVVGLAVVAWVNGSFLTGAGGFPVVEDLSNQVRLRIDSLMTSGGINLLYGPQVLDFTIPKLGSGPIRQVIPGIREHDTLPHLHRLQLRAIAANPLQVVNSFSAAFSFNLLLSRVADWKLR